jgi:hypothetical protein
MPKARKESQPDVKDLKPADPSTVKGGTRSVKGAKNSPMDPLINTAGNGTDK